MIQIKQVVIALGLIVACSCMGSAPKQEEIQMAPKGKPSHSALESASEEVELMAGKSSQEMVSKLQIKKKKTESLSSEILAIKSILNKYQKTSAVKMKVEKAVHLALLDENKNGEGHLMFSKGRLKMVIDEPENSLLLVDGKSVWVVTPLSENPVGPVQVTKMKAAQIKKANALLAVLFGDGAIWNQLEVIKSLKEGPSLLVELKPKVLGQPPEVAKVKIILLPEKGEISEITYWDELDNETSYKFSEIQLNAKVSAREFTYVPPKDAEVSEF